VVRPDLKAKERGWRKPLPNFSGTYGKFQVNDVAVALSLILNKKNYLLYGIDFSYSTSLSQTAEAKYYHAPIYGIDFS